MNNQNTIAGYAMNVMALFEPINADIKPHINVPTIAPTLFMAPIIESSSFVIGPVLRGVFSDNSTDNAGDSQPKIHPWLKIIPLADFDDEKNTNFHNFR